MATTTKHKKHSEGRHENVEPLIPMQFRGGYKLREAAQYLSLAPITVRRLIARGRLRRIPDLRHLLFSRAELDRFLQQK